MINQRMTLSVTGLIGGVALFLAINGVGGTLLKSARLDLTAEKLYTLSIGSRGILENLKEPIRLRLFLSDGAASEVPSLKLYGQRIKELLEEYVRRGGGKITLEVIDPEPFSDAEDEAVKEGIQAMSLDDDARKRLYLGLIAEGRDGARQLIPFFQREREKFLEYDLSRLVHGLAHPKKPVVGILSDLPLAYGPGGMRAVMEGNAQPYAVLSEIKALAKVRPLAADIETIEADVDVLMIAHAKKLTPKALYAIDQYVLRGGKLLALVDPWQQSESLRPGPGGMVMAMGEDHGSNLPTLFAAWGLSMDQGKFVSDRALALRVGAGAANGNQRIVPYPAWLRLDETTFNASDVVSADLDSLHLAVAGHLKPVEGAGTVFTPLITSSPQAALLDVEMIKRQADPEEVLAATKPTGERYVLAARVTGPARTAFPDGAPKGDAPTAEAPKGDAPTAEAPKDGAPKPAAPPPHVAVAVQPINVVAIADADLLEDSYWVRTQSLYGQRVLVPIAGNGALIANVIDHLSGSGDLISLRTRGQSARPFERIDALRRAAGEQLLVREKELRKSLESTERKLAELQAKGKAKNAESEGLSVEEKAAIDSFREDVTRTRRDLRDVQRSLNRDIDRLTLWLKALNIAGVPILVAAAALVLALTRHRRRAAVGGG